MKFISPVVIRRSAARLEAVFTAAATVTRFKSPNHSAGSAPSCIRRLVLLAQVALVILTHEAALVCAAAEAAATPLPAATATNQAGSAAAELAWKELQKALRSPTPSESWRTNSPTQ